MHIAGSRTRHRVIPLGTNRMGRRLDYGRFPRTGCEVHAVFVLADAVTCSPLSAWRDSLYRGEAAIRRACGRTSVRANGYWWAARSANALKSVRGLGLADPLQKEFLHAAKPSDVFLDVGANCGSWTIPAVAPPDGIRSVYALEPSPGPYLTLLENIRLNGCEDKVWAMPIIAGDREGFARFRVDTLDPSTGTSHVTGAHEAAHQPTGALWRPEPVETQVPTFSIDGLVQMGAIEQPTLVKIDTEGYEGLVLDGMSQTAPGVRVMCVEIHPDRLTGGSSVESLLRRVELLGFNVARQAQRGRQIHILCRRN